MYEIFVHRDANSRTSSEKKLYKKDFSFVGIFGYSISVLIYKLKMWHFSISAIDIDIRQLAIIFLSIELHNIKSVIVEHLATHHAIYNFWDHNDSKNEDYHGNTNICFLSIHCIYFLRSALFFFKAKRYSAKTILTSSFILSANSAISELSYP